MNKPVPPIPKRIPYRHKRERLEVPGEVVRALGAMARVMQRGSDMEKERAEYLAELAAAGWPTSALARACGVSETAISKTILRYYRRTGDDEMLAAL